MGVCHRLLANSVSEAAKALVQISIKVDLSKLIARVSLSLNT
jgi:hypothetical protein